jgi:hypothetical protein
VLYLGLLKRHDDRLNCELQPFLSFCTLSVVIFMGSVPLPYVARNTPQVGRIPAGTPSAPAQEADPARRPAGGLPATASITSE